MGLKIPDRYLPVYSKVFGVVILCNQCDINDEDHFLIYKDILAFLMYKYVRDDSNENSTTSGIFFSSNFTGICQRYISDDTGLHTYAVMYCANKDSLFVTDALMNLVLYISEDKTNF